MTVTVVHVLGTLDRGGAETVALELCRRIPPTEVRQRFLLLGESEGRLANRFVAAGATVDRCPISPRHTFAVRLWRWLRAARPDVVTSHVSLASGLVLTMAALAGVPARIARMHSEGDGHPDTERRLRRAVLRVALRRSATAVLGVTSAALAFATPPPADGRYRVVPNGVDVARFARRRVDADHPVLVHIGRAAPEKNRAFLLAVHVEARNAAPDTELFIAGPGGIADLPASACVDPSVRLLGDVDHIPDILARAGVLLLPSHREGLPGVVLEALAAGVPVLASDLPGIRELAGELSGITVLPLVAGPRFWAETALRLAATPSAERAEIRTVVTLSRFALEASVDAWRRVWIAGH
ncbi:glycosyltransferase [Actinophytocola sp.]|uniref:glycosyltransferase n=1 Tax=Actinophytocola sp. TaxID=1872138 RepID=UPI002ED3479C